MALSEKEIFECLKTNLRGAAEDCDKIATTPITGPHYVALCEKLKLVEGACKQAAFWRDDARWLQVGVAVEGARQIARRWLDPISVAGKRMCGKISAALRQMERDLYALETRATGRRGLILPEFGTPIYHTDRNLSGLSCDGIR